MENIITHEKLHQKQTEIDVLISSLRALYEKEETIKETVSHMNKNFLAQLDKIQKSMAQRDEVITSLKIKLKIYTEIENMFQ